MAQAAQFGEAVLLATPFHAVCRIAAEPFAGRLLLDATNYCPERDGAIPALDAQVTTTSQLVADHFDSASVVKAFNTILAGDLLAHAKPSGAVGRRALPIAADRATSKQQAARLIDELGYDAVDGDLAHSWRFERAAAFDDSMNVATMVRVLQEARRAGNA